MAFTDTPEKRAEVAAAEKAAAKKLEIPAGYMEIRLSTKGKLGAPEVFHVRNFTTEDLMDLSATEQSEIPIQVINCLQGIIWEPDCDVKKFHENEVVETLFRIYKEYFNTVLVDMPWKMTDEDKEFLKKQFGGAQSPDYLNRIAAYETEEWVPRWDIDLDSFEFYEVPDDIKTNIKASFGNGAVVEYTMPRYGDVILLKEIIDTYFKKEENEFRQVSENLLQKAQLKKAFNEGKTNNDGSRIYIPKTEEDAYNDYQKRRLIFSTTAVKALHLKSLNGENLENLSLEERMKIVEENPGIFSHGSFKQVTKMFSEMKIGINPKTYGMDPITRKRVQVDYTFRVFALLQAIRDNDSSKVTLTFE